MKIEISAGASRKLNLAQYGGAQYESSDLWVSIKEEHEVQNMSEEVPLTENLSRRAQGMLDNLITQKINEMGSQKSVKTNVRI